MNIVDFSKQNSVINQYVAELRDVDYQKNRKLFRENLIRIGQMMAFEVSKTLNYQSYHLQGGAAIPSRIPRCVRQGRQCIRIGI